MKLWAMFALAGMAGVLGGGRILSGPLEDLLPDAGTHGAWYASRAAGLAAYLCVWLGLAGGLLMSSAWFDGIIGRARLLAIHQTASLAGVVLGLAHGLVLIPDGWTDFGVADILVPFVSYYRPGRRRSYGKDCGTRPAVAESAAGTRGDQRRKRLRSATKTLVPVRSGEPPARSIVTTALS
ncbi:MAG: hypothetical protein HS107_11450 [Thermoflexaceae bacterium]|nr:hypothetical protein [Thermoflexaceae bacterium]